MPLFGELRSSIQVPGGSSMREDALAKSFSNFLIEGGERCGSL